MLSVHSYIKDLYARDGVRKNLRVSFPNGERADLTNKDIIQDSVEMVESICSETVFRFGCVERSMISFECMNVENIMGCQIRCSLEIDTSSLSSSQLYTIQQYITYWGDVGTLVSAEDSDLGYGYYRMPYGLYWVESCPRDQSDRKRRKVTAYSVDLNKVSPVERVRLSTWSPGYDTFKTQPYQLAAINAGYLTPDLFTAWGFGRNTGSNYNYYTWAQIQALGASDSAQFEVTSGGHTYRVALSATYALVDYSERMAGSNTCQLGQVNLSGWDTDEAWYDYQKFFADNGVALPTVAAHSRLPRTYLQPHIGYDQLDQYGTYDHAPIYWLPDYGCPFYMQVYRTSAQKANGFVRLMWDMRLRFYIDGVQQDTKTYFPLADLEASVYQIHSSSFNWGSQSTLTYKATNKYTSNNVDYYTFVDSYASDQALSAHMELYARQVRVDRAGLPQIIRLNNGSPNSIAASSIESIWWEDAEISPIGEVDWKRNDNNSIDEDVMIYGSTFVGNDGKSIYKMLDNSYLEAINFSFDPVAAYFTEWLAQAEFIPFEAAIHDMPWFQPGDAVSLATKDAEIPTLKTIILTQRIRGVTSLKQEIGASGGSTFFEDNAFVDGVAAIYGKQN